MEWQYLPDVSSAYDDKDNEIEDSLYFLKLLIEKHSYIIYKEPALQYQTKSYNKFYKQKRYNLNNNNTSALRSSAVLLIYNFIESISCALMRDIHTHVSDCFKKHKHQNISWTLNKLNSSLKKKIIQYAKTKGDIENCITEYLKDTSLSLDTQIILQWINYTQDNSTSENTLGEKFYKWFSGNVDVQVIKKAIVPYGINPEFLDKIKAKSERGESLFNIKNGRNKLAHGGITFKEYGNTMTIDEIETDFIKVLEYFNGLLDIVNNHLKRQGYLKS